MDIRIKPDGSFEVEIADAKGIPRCYTLEVESPPVAALWACAVLRLDSGNGYRVFQTILPTLILPGHPGRPSATVWECGCPAQKYRPPCKHVRAAQAFRAFLRKLAG